MSKSGSGYELFADARFRELWTANFILTMGMVMLQLGCGWTMTSLTDNAVLVTMVQTMVSLPFFFFSIPAGMANDAWGSRPLLLVSQVWMLLATGLLAAIAWYWDLTPWWILSLLFLIGAGLAVGVIAEHSVVSASVLTAGVVACCGLLLVRRYPIPDDVPVSSAG